MLRIKLKRTLLLFSSLLFPVTMWYFSPYLIIQGASEHIISESFIVFSCMLIFSIFLGRDWCGYLCPAGGLQECARQINESSIKTGWRKYIKFILWFIMLSTVLILLVKGNKRIRVDFFYMTDHGVSVTEVFNYVIYYGVILILTLPALFSGRRGACYYICWMAPFMILGSKIGQKLHLPQLHMEYDTNQCISCKQCNKACPMGLDVVSMVKQRDSGQTMDCIQCGECVEACPKKVIKYKMKWEN